MMKFRRSAKSAKSQDLKSPPVSVPEKHADAIQPPKKVIRALYDYQVENPQSNVGFLSFSAGDFLHVTGRENDPDWYEACNANLKRGLVPVTYFEDVGKQVRKSAGQSTNRGSTTGGHDSGYSEKSSETSMNGGGATMDGQSRMRGTMPKATPVIQGTVIYDFKSERQDELDAKAGEPIIVVAQSNNEWFVAKPIMRLGGPGLIPVSFIEILDMATGKPAASTLEAALKAGIPKVEEWKQRAAEYKSSSIPLGRLDSNQNQNQNQQQQQQQHQSLQQSMERLSIASSARPSHDTSRQQSDGRQRHGSAVSQQQPTTYRNSQMIAPVRANVPSWLHHHGEFYFNVQAKMEDGNVWNLIRHYKDFYGLQLSLIEHFPEAAGQVAGIKRTLPVMPGPVVFVDDVLTGQRQVLLNAYMGEVLRISTDITTSVPIRKFFYPRQSDTQILPDDNDSGYRQSLTSRHSNLTRDSRQSSVSGAANMNIPTSNSPLRHYQQDTENQHPIPEHSVPQLLPQTQYQKPTPIQHQLQVPHSGTPPPLLRNHSALSVASEAPSSVNPYTNTALQQAPPPAKVKVWFGDNNCVVVRLPPDYNYADLNAKLRERWALEQQVDRVEAESVELTVEYKDEHTQAFYRIEGDEDLSIARQRNEPKLTLRVSTELEV